LTGVSDQRPESGDALAADIVRGTCRILLALGFAPLTELPLTNGRRADILAVGPRGECALVEVKASQADFQADRKWPDYLDHADHFYFAVAPGFPLDLLPAGEGLIVADRFEGVVLRAPRLRVLAPARRRRLLLGFARAAAQRLLALRDPDGAGPWPQPGAAR
jgi:hypothetical protein